MRFLTTGGAGIIGSRLAEDLLARRHRVHVRDDRATRSTHELLVDVVSRLQPEAAVV